MNQKGFSTLLIIIIVTIVAVGTGGYFYISKQKTVGLNKNANVVIDEQADIKTDDQKEMPVGTDIPVSVAENISGTVVDEMQPVSESVESTKPAAKPEPTPAPPIVEEATVPQNTCSRAFSPKYSTGPHYTGPLFDAHFHMPNLVDFSALGGHSAELAKGHGPVVDKYTLLDKILCRFDEENVRGAIGFTMGFEEALAEVLQTAKSFSQRSSGKINLFLMPQIFSIASLQNIASANKGLFKGFGEIAMYYGPQKGESPDSKKYMDIYDVAGKNKLIVMIHPDARQESSIENFLQKNPNVTFLIHGFETENSISGIISRHPNAYYSIDAILARVPNSGPFLYTTDSKEVFISKFTQNYNTMLNDAVNRWKTIIEQYPNRFMWGTDRGDPWTFDKEVGVLLEEFGRAFIGRLDPAVQEKFAYKNAEKLLQR